MTVVEERRYIRSDGLPKVTGQARYAADLTMSGMTHAAFLYAGVPSARIRRLDTAAARALPGVMAVITAADVPEVRYGAAVHDRTLFARDVVRFEGEILAAVAAMTPELAREACRLIEVELEELPAVVDPEAALRPGSPLVHEGWSAYDANDGVVREGNDCGYVRMVRGDLDAGFAEADVIVEGRYVADMTHPVPIEPHAVIAQWEGEKVTVWSTTQTPFPARNGVDPDAGDAREPRADRRAPPGRRVRWQVRVPLRGPHRGPVAGRRPAGPPRLRPPPGVRGHGHGPPRRRRHVPDRGPARRHDHGP